MQIMDTRERIWDNVRLRASDLLPIVGLKNYTKRNDDPDGDCGPMYSLGQYLTSFATGTGLMILNVGYTLGTMYVVWEGLERLTK